MIVRPKAWFTSSVIFAGDVRKPPRRLWFDGGARWLAVCGALVELVLPDAPVAVLAFYDSAA